MKLNCVSIKFLEKTPTYLAIPFTHRSGFHLEIVPRGGETIVFYHKGGKRKGLDLKNNTTATSIKGGENKLRGASTPLNETM